MPIRRGSLTDTSVDGLVDGESLAAEPTSDKSGNQE
jgi:hypothetical protein